MSHELADYKFDKLDKEVISILQQNIPVHSNIAIETYKFGLILREIALEELDKKELPTKQRLVALLKSEPFFKMLILVVISLAKVGYGPAVKLITRRV